MLLIIRVWWFGTAPLSESNAQSRYRMDVNLINSLCSLFNNPPLSFKIEFAFSVLCALSLSLSLSLSLCMYVCMYVLNCIHFCNSPFNLFICNVLRAPRKIGIAN